MRLDFNVLWVEDQPESVQAQITAIERALSDEGFKLCVEPHQTLETVQERIRDTVFADQIDLVLVDWDLGAQLKGQEVIQRVRETIRYRDIIFYSAEADTGKLREYAAGQEGVYFSRREDLVEDTKDLFISLVRKVLDIDHTRGIVMGSTSDIDEIIRECLRKLHDNGDDAKKKELIDEALKYVKDASDGQLQSYEKLRKDTTLEMLFKAHGLFDSSRRIRLLLSIIETRAVSSWEPFVDPVKHYLKEVLPQRNDLGHKVLAPEDPPYVITLSGKTVDAEAMRDLRKEILNSRAEIRNLLDAIQKG